MKEKIKDLVKLGLSEYEAKAYYFLIQKTFFTASNLAKIAEIPTTKIYYILESLVKKGFATRIPGKAKKYKAINPSVSLKTIGQDLYEKKQLYEKSFKNLSEIYAKNKDNDDSLDFIEIIEKETVRTYLLGELENNAKDCVCAMHRPPYHVKPIHFKNYIKQNKKLFRPGINYRYIAEINDNIDQHEAYLALEGLEIFVDQGAEVHISENLPIQMAYFDNKYALISPQGSGPSPAAIKIRDTRIMNLLVESFNFHYDKSIPLKEYIKSHK
jgi:sugar-specific transcriptional regulator TrmB